MYTHDAQIELKRRRTHPLRGLDACHGIPPAGFVMGIPANSRNMLNAAILLRMISALSPERCSDYEWAASRHSPPSIIQVNWRPSSSARVSVAVPVLSQR